jgi:alkaline phosphatase
MAGLGAVVGAGALGQSASAQTVGGSVDGTRNLALLIPDGSSRVHDTAARYYRAYETDADAFPANVRDVELSIDRADHTGTMTSYPDDPAQLVTDSAAAGTAMSTGRKTYAGAIAVDGDGTPMTTVLERASEAGYATGLVTTSELTHATPASFAAHVEDRGMAEEIARQYVEETGVDVLLGGDRSHFRAADREDGADLVGAAQERGYSYVETAEELEAVQNGKVLGLFTESGHMDYYLDRKFDNDDVEPTDPGDLGSQVIRTVGEQVGVTNGNVAEQPMLEAMTTKAIELLEGRSEKGFFLLVESARIDHASHSNSFAAIPEQLEYDDTLGTVLDYAETTNDGGDAETLVVGAADHETGGLSLGNNANQYDMNWEVIVEQERSHAFNPAETQRINQEAGLAWGTIAHTAQDVPVYASGPNSEFFAGHGDNTDLLAGFEAHLGL